MWVQVYREFNHLTLTNLGLKNSLVLKEDFIKISTCYRVINQYVKFLSLVNYLFIKSNYLNMNICW